MAQVASEAEHIATPSFWISRKRKRGKSEPVAVTLPPTLLDGAETEISRKLRKKTFDALWTEQQAVIDDILGTFHERITTELSEYVKVARTKENSDSIPSAVILAGNDIAGHTRLFTQIKEQLKNVMEGPVIVISAAQVTNLQGLLRTIISGCLQIDLPDEEEDQQPSTTKNLKLPGRLPYDLDIIEEWCVSQENTNNFRIVIAFQDTEAFPASLLSEFILRNQSRLARLPVILLFGVASTLDQFQQMLPTSVIKSLDTQIFEVRQNDECLNIIIDKVLMEEGPRLRLGPRVLSYLFDRYNSWNQSVEEFISGIKYAYMCHFYANPLSLLLAVPSIDPESLHTYLTTTHLNAIRSLSSMRKYIEEKLAETDTEEVKSLVNDDSYLTSLLPQFVDLVETRARELREAVIVLTKLSERGVKTRRRLGDLYLSTLMGEINLTTPFVRELLQLQRKFSSSSLVEFLSSTIESLPESDLQDTFQHFLDEIEGLTADAEMAVPTPANTPLKLVQKLSLTSEFEIEARPGMRPTKVSQKLRQEKDRANMTTEDEQYTKLVGTLNDILKEVFSNLAPQTNVPLYEAFYFNVTKTHADVFSAQPRESHKTAFRNPAHWLHCQCCTKQSTDDAVISTQPPTSILHELYLDSATGLINLYDWFRAFAGHKQGGTEEQELSEEQLYATFMASLDELVWLGYVKRTMRKTDHVEKLVGG